MTKRDLYYQNCNLFLNQSNCDHVIDDIAISLGVTRFELGIIASSKGLVVGPIKFWLHDNTFLDATQNPIFIPDHDHIKSIQCHASSVLVIEKDATFQALVKAHFLRMCPFTVLLTGKGYPDIATRALLVDLSTRHIPPSLFIQQSFNHSNESQTMADGTFSVKFESHESHGNSTMADGTSSVKFESPTRINQSPRDSYDSCVPDVTNFQDDHDDYSQMNDTNSIDNTQKNRQLIDYCQMNDTNSIDTSQKNHHRINNSQVDESQTLSEKDLQDFEHSFWQDEDDSDLFHKSSSFAFSKNQLYSIVSSNNPSHPTAIVEAPCIDPYEIFFSDDIHECTTKNDPSSIFPHHDPLPLDLNLSLPKIKPFLLADCDPDGFEIYQTYQSGSASLHFYSINLACNDLEWLGIKPSQVFGPLKIKIPEPTCLLRLSLRDRKKISKYVKENPTSPHKVMMLRQLLMGYKAELQVMDISTLMNEIIIPVLGIRRA